MLDAPYEVSDLVKPPMVDDHQRRPRRHCQSSKGRLVTAFTMMLDRQPPGIHRMITITFHRVLKDHIYITSN